MPWTASFRIGMLAEIKMKHVPIRVRYYIYSRAAEETMSRRTSLELFVARPRSSAVLALLFIVLGIVSISGLVPLSTNRRYFPAHEWLLASLSWVLAVLFGYCALIGMKSGSRPSKR